MGDGFFHEAEGDPEGLGGWLGRGETPRKTSGALEECNGLGQQRCLGIWSDTGVWWLANPQCTQRRVLVVRDIVLQMKL